MLSVICNNVVNIGWLKHDRPIALHNTSVVLLKPPSSTPAGAYFAVRPKFCAAKQLSERNSQRGLPNETDLFEREQRGPSPGDAFLFGGQRIQC